ncbi:MAG: hypothetical protein K2Q10_00870, partial [Rhodospirillales bacterium]|nr:hypothetical protein [Rhodospirillales bacterium]
LYEATLELFQAFDGPLVYTPGDNEWTDCHRARAGGFDPLERLAKLRTMFFATPHSFGRAPMPVQRQSGDYVENQRWAWGGVMFATLHVVGSNDNLQRDAIAAQEHFQRTEANLTWLRETVGQAGDAAALVLFMQANPGFELKEAEQRSGFNELLTELSHAVAAFGRPVLLVHGDTHYFRVDKPLKDADGRTVETFTRLEVFGEKDIHGVLVTADPELPEVFSFREMLVR